LTIEIIVIPLLKEIKLTNFKGVKDLTLSFNSTMTEIYGANATGKSTIFDAFYWLFFNKNSLDKSDFDIKTLMADNTPVRKATHSVEAVVMDDSIQKRLKKEYREKWQKKTGKETPEFVGHETKYFIDDVPMSKKDYDSIINEMIAENIFKLITNPFYFSNMDWKAKRKMVLDVAGEPTIEEIVFKKPELRKLIDRLENRDIDAYLKMLNIQKKKIKEESAGIEPRIDELTSGMYPQHDKERLDSELSMIESELTEIMRRKDSIVSENSKEINALNAEINHKIEFVRAIENDTQKFNVEQNAELFNRLNELKDKVDEYKRESASMSLEQRAIEIDIVRFTKRKEELLKQWHEVNEKSYQVKENDTHCYACGQELPDAEKTIAENKERFLANQKRQLDEIKADGQETAKRIIEFENRFIENKDKSAKILKELPEMEKESETILQELTKIKEEKEAKAKVHIEKFNAEIEKLKEKLSKYDVNTTSNQFSEKLSLLNNQKKELSEKINEYEHNEKTLSRIGELERREKKLSSELATLEKDEFIANQFTKRKIELMDKSIREKFGDVQFKMFNTLINGEEEPTCEILIDGVPFINANRAAQINTGIKIINAFSKHYGYSAPIFIDNAEAVNTIEKTSSQVVKLIVVSPEYKNENQIVLKPLK